jgi:hypothetical protein
MGTPRRKGRCRNCGIYGHWAEDCKRPKKDKKKDAKEPEANLAVHDHGVHGAVLLMATSGQEEQEAAMQVVHLAEKDVVPVDCTDGVWVLDTGASNHMTGTRSALQSLNDKVKGTVSFGDGSHVEIQGIGSMVMQGQNQQHKVLTDVYFIPKLKSNIISLGQLEEKGCEVCLKHGRLNVIDPEGTLLISAPRTKKRLYTIQLGLTDPVCLLMKHNDEAWQWHARFGHLNFRALRELGRKGMVDGMPVVDHVEQVCDGCTLRKQHRRPFPQASSFRAEQGLELVHADLCGQISPKTPGGNSYFLLVVDDCSRYMWVEFLKTKDQTLDYFKKIKLRAEVDQGSKLKALRTDRGGEFTSNLFSVFCTETGIKHYTTTPYTPQHAQEYVSTCRILGRSSCNCCLCAESVTHKESYEQDPV